MSGLLLFGGSFNPIHHGHLIVARYAAEHLGVPRVVLIPSAWPPHKRTHDLAPASDRLAICRLAVEDDPLFEVSQWELEQSGPNFSLLTVQHFRTLVGARETLYWLIGDDSLRELPTWHRVRDLVDACTLVSVVRPGFEDADLTPLAGVLDDAQMERIRAHRLAAPPIGISATAIRQRCREGRTIRYLVPEAVRRYVTERRLYASR